MSDATNFLEQKVGDHVFRATDYAEPATVYVGLATAVSDSEAGTLTEVSGGSYARVAVTFGAGSQVSGKYKITNSADVTFPTATANWGTATHFFIADASSGGNILVVAALTASRTINNGDTFKFLAGQLAINVA